jgi:predicted enzyme related to lactoylglutathione lyase
MVGVGDGTGGGMMSDSDAPPHWLAYVGVDDIQASTKRAKELGAAILQDVMQVGDFGWMSILRDPTGATLALWKAEPRK